MAQRTSNASVLAALPLLVVVSVLALSTESAPASGDEGELQQHELRWIEDPDPDVHRNKEGIGGAVWGGGSFLKLISKLAIEGCNVNAIAIQTPDGETLYHHFQAPDFVNPTFSKGNYTRQIPKHSTAGFTCVDACDILVGPNQTAWAEKVRNEKTRCLPWDEDLFLPDFALTSDCNDDFTEEVKSHFLTRVPIFQDTCIAYFSKRASSSQVNGIATKSIRLSEERDFDVFYRAVQPMVLVNNDDVVWNGDSIITADEHRYMFFVRLAMHESCHQQQNWYVNTFYRTYDIANRGKYMLWKDTQAGHDFMQVAGYVKDGDGEWILEEDNRYYNGGYDTPKERSADVCAGYLTDRVYEADYPDVHWGDRATPLHILTPEMREWVKKWMLVDF